MNRNRILRYFLAGWAFLLSTVFHFWVFGGKVKGISTLFATESGFMWAALLVALVSAPFIGFILAPIGTGILHLFFGHGTYFKYPRSEKEIEAYFGAIRGKLGSPALQSSLDDLKSRFLDRFGPAPKGSGKLRDLTEKLYGFFIFVSRTGCHEDYSRHVIRQFANFWTHFNVLLGILAGLGVGLMAKTYIANKPGRVAFFGLHDSLFLYELPFLLVYIVFAYFQMKRTGGDARDLEYKWLMNQ